MRQSTPEGSVTQPRPSFPAVVPLVCCHSGTEGQARKYDPTIGLSSKRALTRTHLDKLSLDERYRPKAKFAIEVLLTSKSFAGTIGQMAMIVCARSMTASGMTLISSNPLYDA